MTCIVQVHDNLCHAMACFEWNLIQISSGYSILGTTFVEIMQWTLHFCSMTHCDITMGNDVARNVYCDIIIGHGITMVTYLDIIMHTDVARIIIYYVLLHPNVILLFS